MSLIGMNRANTHFLFEDKIKRELQVYTLERKNENEQEKIMRNMRRKISEIALDLQTSTS